MMFNLDEIPEKIIMLDGEFDGVIPERDELLELSMIKCIFDKEEKQYKVGKKYLELYIKTDAQPTRDFHREHLKECFERCNKSETTMEDARIAIEEFIGDWYGQAWPAGDCVTTDIGFLRQNKLLVDNDYDEDDNEVKGTVDFRIMEIAPLKRIAKCLGWKKPETNLAEHRSLNDCYNQLGELNSILKFIFDKFEE